jgi:hypothetical protein
VKVPAGGSAFVPDISGVQCGAAAIGVYDPQAGVTVTRAQYRPTGLTLYVPVARVPLVTFGDRARAGGLVNAGADASFVLLVNEGRAGTVTLEISGPDGRYIASEYVALAAGGSDWHQIATPFAAGSVAIISGKVGQGFGGGDWNRPESAPGTVWGWCFTGPPAGITSPGVREWARFSIAP